MGPLREQRHFLLTDCVRIVADLSRGKYRCWLGTSSRRNREQQKWNSVLDLGSHVDGHGTHADADANDRDLDRDNGLDNDNNDYNDYNTDTNDNHHAILGLQHLRQSRERDGTDSDQRGSSGANRLSAWWYLHPVVF